MLFHVRDVGSSGFHLVLCTAHAEPLNEQIKFNQPAEESVGKIENAKNEYTKIIDAIKKLVRTQMRAKAFLAKSLNRFFRQTPERATADLRILLVR